MNDALYAEFDGEVCIREQELLAERYHSGGCECEGEEAQIYRCTYCAAAWQHANDEITQEWQDAGILPMPKPVALPANPRPTRVGR